MSTSTPGSVSPAEAAMTPSSLGQAARAERAQRVAAMLDRWADEDRSGEPDWDADALEPLRIGAPPADSPAGAP